MFKLSIMYAPIDYRLAEYSDYHEVYFQYFETKKECEDYIRDNPLKDPYKCYRILDKN